MCDTVFYDMGMRNGDIVVAMDGKKVGTFSDIVPDMLLNTPKTVQVKRDGELIDLQVPESFVAQLLAMSTQNYKTRFWSGN